MEEQQRNVARLNEYKSKLILFPRREGVHKKGEINDSTAEQLKAATTKQTGIVMPQVAVEKSVEWAKVQKDAPMVYRKIRQDKTNKKHTGKREKRAKEEAEKKK